MFFVTRLPLSFSSSLQLSVLGSLDQPSTKPPQNPRLESLVDIIAALPLLHVLHDLDPGLRSRHAFAPSVALRTLAPHRQARLALPPAQRGGKPAVALPAEARSLHRTGYGGAYVADPAARAHEAGPSRCRGCEVFAIRAAAIGVEGVLASIFDDAVVADAGVVHRAIEAVAAQRGFGPHAIRGCVRCELRSITEASEIRDGGAAARTAVGGNEAMA